MPTRYKALLASIVLYQVALTYVVFDMISNISNSMRALHNMPPASLFDGSVGFSNVLLLGGSALVLVVLNGVLFAVSSMGPPPSEAK